MTNEPNKYGGQATANRVVPVNSNPSKLSGIFTKPYQVVNLSLTNTIYIGQNSALSAEQYGIPLRPGASLKWLGDSELWAVTGPGLDATVSILYSAEALFIPAPKEIEPVTAGDVILSTTAGTDQSYNIPVADLSTYQSFIVSVGAGAGADDVGSLFVTWTDGLGNQTAVQRYQFHPGDTLLILERLGDDLSINFSTGSTGPFPFFVYGTPLALQPSVHNQLNETLLADGTAAIGSTGGEEYGNPYAIIGISGAGDGAVMLPGILYAPFHLHIDSDIAIDYAIRLSPGGNGFAAEGVGFGPNIVQGSITAGDSAELELNLAGQTAILEINSAAAGTVRYTMITKRPL